MKLLKNFITVIGLVAVVLFGFMLYHQSTDEPIDDMSVWHDLHEKAKKQMSTAKKTVKDALEKHLAQIEKNIFNLSDETLFFDLRIIYSHGLSSTGSRQFRCGTE